jgi:peptidylprolyl isomerase
MASGPGKNNVPAGEPDRAKMIRVLIPAVAIGAIVILVAVVAGISDGSSKKMSDGSNGTVDDPDLKEITPGVKYRDLKEGSGEACSEGAKVKINYTGWIPDGTEFDSSKGRGPADFDLKSLIPGWQIGIPGMKPGGIRKLVIAPEKGYGGQAKGKIPASSTLIFEVELISTSPGPRPRRFPFPSPAELDKQLSDGTSPKADDPNLKPIGDKGLQYRDIKVGDGPVVQAGASVLVDYAGWTLANGKVFDTSWKPGGDAFTASLSRGVIVGWQQGIPGMKVGGVRKIVIPPELAYGRDGSGPIPPNATLVFEVEVLRAD